MSDDRSRPGPAGCEGCTSGGCPSHSAPLDPRLMTVDERRRWLETYKRHLEERLEEVGRQLADL